MPEHDEEDAREAADYHLEEYAWEHALGRYEVGERPGVDVPLT